MLQAGGEADLALESLGPQQGGEVGQEHLERDGPVVAKVLGEPDHGHAAPAELALESVPVLQGLTQRDDGIGQVVRDWSALRCLWWEP